MRTDGKGAAGSPRGEGVPRGVAAADDAPQRPNGIGGSDHVTAAVGSSAVVEVELLDGSAKDVKVLGEQASTARTMLRPVLYCLQATASG